MNLLLVSIDSLRHDFLSHNHPGIHTPRFDDVTAGFLRVDSCFSVSTVTRPVHLSLFSGLYPFEHGIAGQRSVGQRPGIPLLFEVCSRGGFAVHAFSEASQVFEGLSIGADISALDPRPDVGARAVGQTMSVRRGPQAVFLHYWSTHTPYGADDGLAMGETAQMLKSGRAEMVIARYRRAVEEVFEHKLSPLLEGIDLGQWCVAICGDHGESWSADELFHGESLRNRVLRVPLLLHVPYRSSQSLVQRPIVSLIDLFPTLCSLLQLPCEYRGFGTALGNERARESHYLAEIRPIGKETASSEAPRPAMSAAAANTSRIWALFDDKRKFTFDELEGRGTLEETMSERCLERPAAPATVSSYAELYAQLRSRSSYCGPTAAAPDLSDQALLDHRLRQLGYLG